MNLARSVAFLTAPLRRRVALMVGRGVVRLVDDSGGLQRIQAGLLAGETREGVEHVQGYGLTAHPIPGAELVAVFVGGNRDHGLAVAIDDRRHRPAGLEEGEVCLYSSAGQRILLRADGDVVIATAGTVVMEAPSTHVLGNLEVDGTVTALAAGASVELGAFRDAYNVHSHSETGGTTGPPTPTV